MLEMFFVHACMHVHVHVCMYDVHVHNEGNRTNILQIVQRN